MKRHAFSTRIWHWLNALSVIVLFMSGLNISNAHPYLYWGAWGFDPRDAWAQITRFPGWATIPNYYNLAAARDWHVLFAWVFSLGLLFFLLAALLNRHLRRDVVPARAEWKAAAIWADFRAHLRFDFDSHEGKYNILQKLTYTVLLFVLLPLMIFSGMALSPALNAAWPFLLDVFGGRQSARSIHFIVAWMVMAFLILHVVLVLLHRPLTNLRDMITGGPSNEAA